MDDDRLEALLGLAEDAGLGLLELTRAGEVRRASAIACELCGLPASALQGRPLEEIFTPESRLELPELLASAREGPAHRELELLRGDGAGAPALVALRPLQDGILMALRDLPEARRIPGEPRQRGYLEQVLDLMPTPLVLVDPATTRVTFANRAAERAAGGSFPRETSESRHRYSPLTDSSGRVLDAAEMPSVRASRGERLDGLEFDWHLPDGRVRTVLFFSALLPAGEGNPATVVMPFLDVTRLKAAEAQLQSAIAARDEFLSIASHELRTPLTTLQLELQAMLRRLAASDGGLPPGYVGARLETCGRQVTRLSRLVNTLLDLSRLNAGRVDLELLELDLAEVAREAVARAKDDAARAGCALELNAPAPVTGLWDRNRLDQIAQNLISNAIKYGGGRPIEIAVDQEGNRARLRVVDRGIGIAPEDQARIFDRFERAVSERHYGGFGLGLWIVRQSVHALQGGIWVQSKVGAGATFTVELPRQRREATPAPFAPQ